MSSNDTVSYSNSKLKNLINSYSTLAQELNNYESELNQFDTVVKTLFSEGYNQGSTLINEIVYDNKGNEYLLTKNNLLIKTGNTDNTQTQNSFSEPSEGEVVAVTVGSSTRDAYYIGNNLNASNYSNDTTMNNPNQIAQYGLNDLGLNFDGNGQLYNQGSNKSELLVSNTACDYEAAHKCSGYAQMNNETQFGLQYIDGNGCYCYKTTNGSNEYEKEYIIETIPITDIPNISYLGILFDGGVYGLKDLNYSGNFNDFYNPDNSKMVSIIAASEPNCNPFTGYGPYNINVNSLDADNNCDVKSNSVSNG